VLKRIKSLLVYPCCACVTPSSRLVRWWCAGWSRLGAVARLFSLEVSRVCSSFFPYCWLLCCSAAGRGWCCLVCPAFVGRCCVLVLSARCARCLVVCLIVPLRERLFLGCSRGGRVVCLSLGLGACPWVVVSVPLGFAMSAVSSSSGVVVSVEVCSHSAGFGESVRLLSRLSWCPVTVSVCPYTGAAFLSADLLPAAVPVWPAIRSLAWADGRSEGDADDLFVARLEIGGDNARYFALAALLESVGV